MLNEGKVVNFNNKNNNFIVMLGTPGAGKSFVINSMMNIHNYKVINVDSERELLAKKMGLDLKDPKQAEKIREITGGTTENKNRVIRQLKTIISQPRNNQPNIILDSGGGQPEFISGIIKQVNEIGYETTLVYVRTELATALARNSKRERRLPDTRVKQYHEDVIKSFNATKDLYDHVWVVRNDEAFDISNRPSVVSKIKSKEIIESRIHNFDQFVNESKKRKTQIQCQRKELN